MRPISSNAWSCFKQLLLQALKIDDNFQMGINTLPQFGPQNRRLSKVILIQVGVAPFLSTVLFQQWDTTDPGEEKVDEDWGNDTDVLLTRHDGGGRDVETSPYQYLTEVVGVTADAP